MFINKTQDGRNNICGRRVAYFRTELRISQRELADRLQLVGLDMDKNAIQRIEAGKRFVTDIEIIGIARVLDKTIDELLFDDPDQSR
ncbi:MAG: helix-turn-helix transcriptional regulator [Clostridia bacterium]|nr:helix-turn-helix transcriptional regulator [Clostridia bacterium]